MNTPPVRRKPAVGKISRAETKKRAPGSPICQCFAIELMTCSSRRPTMCMHAPRLFITFNKTARQPSVSQDLPPVRSPRPSQADRLAQRASTRWSGTKQAVWDVRPPATYIIRPGVRAPANREIISQENDANGPVFRGRRDEAAVIAERRRGHLDRSTPAEKQASAVKCSDRKLILQQNSTKYAAWRSGALKKRRRWRIETKDKQLWKCACQRRWRC